MGRGRAKAKQTKVARQLKYNSGGTDLARLAEELGVSSNDEDAYEEDAQDPYARYGEYLDDDDEDGTDADGPGRRR